MVTPGSRSWSKHLDDFGGSNTLNIYVSKHDFFNDRSVKAATQGSWTDYMGEFGVSVRQWAPARGRQEELDLKERLAMPEDKN